ncbi:protein disulfide-isomerase TMX3 [Lutzomyia longipalpis]|uniref:Putative disulfide-isomerase txndc10 n=1 Tax=Lutzomyia longipalpis TaxID=7200 RepID=A0A7G3AHB0_LUTLO|nr:protein disulfide-isomerase TMX3 [Lutzomyia longipalpis]
MDVSGMFTMKFLALLLLVFLGISEGSRVIELSDRFLDVRHEGQWFVKFYAPWCAHCKRLEPVWSHVAQTLYNTNVRVGKVDCTRFTSVAQVFNINSFPTIIFMKDGLEFVYNGERTKEELIHFVMRMSGPPVQLVTRTDSVDMLKASHPIFFSYIGKQEGLLWDTYASVAEVFQPHGFFYATSFEIARDHFDIDTLPAVIVYKERNHFYYPLSGELSFVEPSHMNRTLHAWVNEERFSIFPKVTRSNINELMLTRKYLVLAVVEENRLAEVAAHELEFRDMIESIIRMNHDKFHSRFQFGWIGTPELAHSIAMDTLATPHLLVLNSTTSEHHIPDDEPLKLTSEAIQVFLENIHNQSAPVYGGNSFYVRIYRTYFEAKRSLSEMWRGNPVLTSVLFGLPLGFLSLIIYSICCADILDADEEDIDTHEKNE